VNVPPEILHRLRQTALAAGARNARALGHVGRLLKDLGTAGIDVAVLKGADLVERVYADVSLRPMADVDLLVRSADLERTSALLASRGYAPAAPAPGDAHQAAIDENLHVEPVRKPGGPLVEIHYAIGVPSRVGGVDMDGVWSRMEPARVGGADALVLAPEDLILHLCIHVALHHGFDSRLVQLMDLHTVVDGLGDRIAWTTVDRRAREWGVRRAVALTFALAERLLGPFAPSCEAPVLEAAAGDPDPVARAERLLFQTGARGMGSANLPALFGPGTWRARAGLVLRRVFPSRQEMAFTYRVPAGSPRLVLLYPRRFWELWRRHGGTVRAVAGGDAAANHALSVEQERAALVKWMKREP
jgi:alkylhydroperoxidase family enzyme